MPAARVQRVRDLRPTVADGWKRYVRDSDRMRAAVLRLPGGTRVPLHDHRESEELFYVVSGSCRLEVAGEGVTLEAGDIAVVEAGEAHALISGEGELVLLAVVAPNLEDAVLHE